MFSTALLCFAVFYSALLCSTLVYVTPLYPTLLYSRVDPEYLRNNTGISENCWEIPEDYLRIAKEHIRNT